MMTKIPNAVGLATLVYIAAVPSLQAAPATLTDETISSSGVSNYTDASSIPVSSTDLIEGLLPINTDYVGTHESAGGTLNVLTDGTTGVGANAPTSSTNAAFDLGSSSWYAEYALPTSIKGFTINSVVVTTGHQDNRLDQDYDILVSTNGTSFFSLSDGTTQTLGNAGAGFNYSPSANNEGGAAQSTVSPTGANLGSGIKYVEFVALDDGSDVYRELDVKGSIPEPSTWAQVAFGAVLLALMHFRSKYARS